MMKTVDHRGFSSIIAPISKTSRSGAFLPNNLAKENVELELSSGMLTSFEMSRVKPLS